MKASQEMIELLKDPAHRERGFSLLVKTYGRPLYWHARSMVKSHDAADDVVQNTYLKAWKALEGFRFEADLYTWLYRICTNEALTLLRKEKPHVPMEVVREEAADSAMDSEAALQKLARALDTLPERQRMVFEMRYYNEMSYADMADALKVTEGSLKASYHLAVKKIEAFLTGG